jgi:cyclohexanecarboxylate-CoA ligase
MAGPTMTTEDRPEGLVHTPPHHASHQAYYRNRTLWDDVADHARQRPDKVAIVGYRDDGTQRDVLSYRHLTRLANRFAGALVELGVRPGDIVSFQLPNWWQMPALHLACVRIGAVANPIITILRQREVRFILERAKSRVCIVPGTFRGFDHAAMLAELQPALPHLEHVFAIGSSFDSFFCDRRWEDEHPSEELDALRPDPNAVDQLIFSSGTTGEPKGVLHSSNTLDVASRGISDPLGLGHDDVVLMFSPLGHQTGFLYGMCMPLVNGMKVVLQDTWNPGLMLRLISDEAVTWTLASTTFVVDACAATDAATGPDLSTLRFFTCGGAPIPPQVVRDAHSKLGTKLIAVWGMSEVGSATITLPTDPIERVCNSDGAPNDWVQLRIADSAGKPLPTGTPGRLLIKTAAQHLGYFERPDLDEASYDPDGWFDTGDLARMDESGYIRITGRAKDLIIRGGENIPAVEVEAALFTHPKVAEVAVVAYPDSRLGERACAVVVAAPGKPPTLAELRAHLDEQGMAKQFWPERLELRASLPKTESGKTQKFVLREELVQ